MPWKAFVAGEEALATEVQSYLMDQAVSTFVDGAQRTSQLPAPVKGQCSVLASRPQVIQVFDGSAWVDTAPFVQSGTVVVVTNAGGGAVITFPVPFAATPGSVQLTDGDTFSTGGVNFGLIGSQLSATGFGLVIRNLGGAPIDTRPVRVSWLAHGVRA